MANDAMSMTASEGGGTMEIIVEGTLPEEDLTNVDAGMCTQEPGDNCWLHLD